MKSDYYVVKFWQKSEHFYFLGLKGLSKDKMTEYLTYLRAVYVCKMYRGAHEKHSKFFLVETTAQEQGVFILYI